MDVTCELSGMAARHGARRPAIESAGPALTEVLALWALYGYETTAIYLTYSRRSVDDDVPSGPPDPRKGATHLLIFVRHPFFAASIAFVPIALSRLPPSAQLRAVRMGTAGAGIAVAAMMAARARLPVAVSDILAVTGVGGALGVCVASARISGVGPIPWREDGDGLRLAAAAVLLATAIPWLLADLGIYVGDVPILGTVFLSRERLPPGATQRAVHLGHHHGMDGVLLALTALALSRPLGKVQPSPVREGLSLYLAGLLVYGIARAAEDVWNEQVVKRGWTSFKLPLVVQNGRPTGRRTWGALLLAAILVHRRWVGRAGS